MAQVTETSGPSTSGSGEAPLSEPMKDRKPPRQGFWGTIEDQLALGPLIREYLTPVEVNNFWYALGGVLAIALGLEIITGFLLSLRYVPDAGRAYDITKALSQEFGWAFIVNFHFYNAFLIFGLVVIHMLRVFISGGYRRGKQGLWLVGVVLAVLTFVLSATGESLHWDEVGFAVPWHASEMLQALGLASAFNYTFAALKDIPTATEKLGQIYAAHIAIAAILLVVFIIMHYYLIKMKGISLPFWLRPSGRTAPFSAHIREWALVGGIILGAVVLVALIFPRDQGTAPQLLPSSPLYGSEHGPGGLGYKPTFPISWTHGMNVFVAEVLGIDPDIWGTMVGMLLLLGALVIIPFVDTGDHEPGNRQQAFDLRKRGWAFLAMGIFWLVLIVGVITNAIAGPG
jgi:quinol-cytochrome oxidoreductase complex cytochrome b subunit